MAARVFFRSMSIARRLRRRARLLVGPVLGLLLAGYFAYHLVEGDRGVLAWLRLTRELQLANSNLAGLQAQHAALENRVVNMRPEHIDPDLLDEEVRRMLDVARPDEVVIIPAPAAR
jgi:cell division protein FtsB